MDIDRSTPLDSRALWILVGLTVLGLGGASGLVLAGVGQGERPPFLSAGGAGVAPRGAAPPGPSELRLAGSGSNLPLTRRLVSAFERSRPGVRVTLHESIGSGGAVRAVQGGAIELGLLSRPLAPEEREPRLRVVPYARVAVILAANPSVRETGLRRADLLALYAGERRQWRDGHPVVLIQRERGDSSHDAVARALPRFGGVNAHAWRRARWRVVYRDDAMQEALLATPGAVGLLDFGALVAQGLALRVLAVDGIAPSRADPLPTGYPFRKDLAFLVHGEPSATAAAFLAFVRTEAAQRVIRESGYLPLDGGPP